MKGFTVTKIDGIVHLTVDGKLVCVCRTFAEAISWLQAGQLLRDLEEATR